MTVLARTTADIAFEETAPLLPPVLLDDPLGEGAESEAEALYGPAAGTERFIAARLMGGGAFAGVREVLTPGDRKTPWPPAPTAEVLGARKGTYWAASKQYKVNTSKSDIRRRKAY